MKKQKGHKTPPQKENTLIEKKEDILSKITAFRYTGWILGGLYVLLMSIVSFGAHKIGDYGVETDFFWSYVPQAQHFLDGHMIIDKYRGPLYPIILALVQVLIGNYFKSGMLIAILSAGMIIFFTYELLKRLFNPLVALATVVILAVNTTFNLYTYSAGTDMFFNFLVSAALFYILKDKTFKPANLLIAGVFSGLAYITRYNGIFIVVGALAAILFINIYRSSWKKRMVALLFFVVPYLLMITPWGVYTHKEKGKAFWNQNYQNVAYEYLAKDKMGWDEFWYQGNRDKFTSLTQIVLNEPGNFFKKMVSNSFDHLIKDLRSLIGWHVGLLSIIGLLLLYLNPPSKEQWAYYLINFLFFGVLLLVFYNERFSMFIIPFYTVFGMNLLFSENKILKKKLLNNPSLQIVIILILGFWTFGKSYAYNSENINSGDKILPKMASQFNKKVPEKDRGDKIYARKAHIAYYLGLEKKYIPQAKNYYQQVAYFWRYGIDYVYYGMWEAGRGLDYLRNPQQIPPDFELIAYETARNKSIVQKENSKSPYKIKVKKVNQAAMLYKVNIDSVRISMIAAGEYLLQKHPDAKEASKINVMAATPYLAFYANMNFSQIPSAPIDSLYLIMKQKNINYLYIGNYEAAGNIQLGSLIIGENIPEWLIPEASFNTGGSFPAYIYKLKD